MQKYRKTNEKDTITEDKIINDIIKNMDENQNGFISKYELRNIFKKYNITLTNIQLDELLSSMDSNDNNVVEYNEFEKQFGDIMQTGGEVY